MALGRGDVLREGRKGCGDLTEVRAQRAVVHERERPRVGDEVVEAQIPDVLFGGEAYEHAVERALVEPERLLAPHVGPTLEGARGLGLGREIDELRRALELVRYALLRRSADELEDRPQRIAVPHHRAERPLEARPMMATPIRNVATMLFEGTPRPTW